MARHDKNLKLPPHPKGINIILYYNNINIKLLLTFLPDYRQMFDAIDLEQALSDVYDVGVKYDNLALLYKANNDVHMAVNTPYGLSERRNLKNVVLQGDTFGSILASVQVDSIGKEVEEAAYGYKYKDVLTVSLLGLVDDLIGITDAGYKAQQMNAVLNVKTAEKRLQYGESKCKSMLVSKNANHCVLNSPLMVDKWSVTHVDNPNTGEIDLVETYEGLVWSGLVRRDYQKEIFTFYNF
jgi:hypothetical protein